MIDIHSTANQVAFGAGLLVSTCIGGYLIHRKVAATKAITKEQIEKAVLEGYNTIVTGPK